MSTTIKVSEATRDRVKALGATTNQTAEGVIASALDELERRLFWAEYARNHPSGIDRVLESTIDDGLEPELWGDDDLA